MEATRTNVDKKIDEFVKGDLEHAAEILSALWEIMNKDGDTGVPSNTPPSVSSSRFCFLPSVTRKCLHHMKGRAGHEPCPLDLCKNRPY